MEPHLSLALVRLIVYLAAMICAVWPMAGADRPSVIELWPGEPPDESGSIGAERVRMSPKLDRKQVEVTESTRLITDVTEPTLTVYRPATDKDTGTAMLICPGGGYWDLYWELEGEEVAAKLNSIGVTGIILKYRVPRRPDEPQGEPARRPLQDAQRAVSLVRSRAVEWGLDPRRIGMVGFSAGGHLALATATGFEKRTYEPRDEIDTFSCRPDFAIAVYPGYLKARDKDELAPGWHIPSGTPPVFLAHGGEDIISPPEHSVLMYLALRRAGVPAELHIYAGAAHDFGVRASDQPCSTWTEACAEWLRHGNFLAAEGDTRQSPSRAAPFEVPGLWEYSAPLIAPEARDHNPSRAQKDPSVVLHGGNWHVFMTVKLPGKSAIEYCSFSDWAKADASPRTILEVSVSDYYCAPQVFYFRPHQQWYLVYQMGVPGTDKMWVAYSTTADITDPHSWTQAMPILDGGKDDPRVVGGLDYWIICDDERAYLFLTSLDGRMWRLWTRLEDFPKGFGHCELALEARVFEASHTYKLKGLDQYLTVIEENGQRYYKAYLAERLDGEWRPVADTPEQPFAGWNNIRPATGVEPWTDNVSHGELVRDGWDETLTVDPANLRFIFQGMLEKHKSGKDYGQFSWRIGMLTPAAKGANFQSTHAAPDATPRTPMGPLRICASNPRYFADPSGRPVYLTGSHTWQSLQDGILSNYTAVVQPFDDAAFTRAWVWKSFTRGHNTLLMENLADSPGWIAGRAAMGHTKRLADRRDLAALVPHPELASSHYCLAIPGRDYVVYLPDGGEVIVDLEAGAGEFAVEWIHAANGTTQTAEAVAGGAGVGFHYQATQEGNGVVSRLPEAH